MRDVFSSRPHLAAYRQRVLDHISPLPEISMEIREGYVLTQDVVAKVPIPVFTNSAMDGFLCHTQDFSGEGPWEFSVVGDIPAGHGPEELPPGHALRIMTGAPTGEDVAHLSVIPVEDTNLNPGPQPLPEKITIFRAPTRRHIRPQGGNIQVGDLVAKAGTTVDAGAVAALVAAGVDKQKVRPLPKVAVISSGEELVAPGQPLLPGKIHDSNGPMLAALARQAGAQVVQHHSQDDPESLERLLSSLEVDLVVTAGGISAGAFDVVREVGVRHGFWFGELEQRPGAPQGVGMYGNTPVITLPGNPVAAYVSFIAYALPAIRKLAGKQPLPRFVRAVNKLAPAKRRTTLTPVTLSFGDQLVASPMNESGPRSHYVGSLAGMDGLAVLDPDSSAQFVDVIIFNKD